MRARLAARRALQTHTAASTRSIAPNTTPPPTYAAPGPESASAAAAAAAAAAAVAVGDGRSTTGAGAPTALAVIATAGATGMVLASWLRGTRIASDTGAVKDTDTAPAAAPAHTPLAAAATPGAPQSSNKSAP